MPPSLGEAWHPGFWRQFPAKQQPEYADQAALDKALQTIRSMPPLITSWEVESLRTQLAEAGTGRRFVLQAGDCAERFDDCSDQDIVRRLKIMLQMSLALVYGLQRHVVRIGRFAGQYAKPRSSPFEVQNGVSLPAYRGDIINGAAFTAEARKSDPQRLVEAYSRSALTLNFVRALSEGGFADLHHPEYWDLDFVRDSPLEDAYRGIVASIRSALQFMATVADAPTSELQRVQFFTSHEALHLPFEEALTRSVPRRDGFYNLATHFPWIGMRTADPEGAHVAYAAGLRNPVAVKIGPGMTASWLRDLIGRLNPENVAGRLTFIHRMGADKIEDALPRLVRTVQGMGASVVWICDPMHGNTETTAGGVKTRRFENIKHELDQAVDLHAALGSNLGGIHIELTGDNVTECTGGARGLSEVDLERAYRSFVDPRLNAEQSLELALSLVHRDQRPG